ATAGLSVCATWDTDARAQGGRRSGPGNTALFRRPDARGAHGARGRRGSPRRRVLGVAVGLLEVLHQRLGPPGLDHPRALHQDLLALIEFPGGIAPERRLHVVVHAVRITRTGFPPHPAIDALEGVDLVAARVLLDRGIGMLTRLDVDALGGTSRRTEKAGRA